MGAASGYKYAQAGPPFNFLGNLCETQKKAFWEWLDKQNPKHQPISEWYQIRAHQLRKTAGLLEEFYATHYLDPLESRKLDPTFKKEEWQPGPDGHWPYQNRADHHPTVVTGRIKDRHRHMLQMDDEGVFWMNWLRNHIERHEDKAVSHAEAPTITKALRAELDAMFDKPEYEAVLVKNESQLYKGQPYFRVHPLDDPTIWEKEQFSHNAKGVIDVREPEGGGI